MEEKSECLFADFERIEDKMIISPPLIIKASEIDELTNIVWTCLDKSQKELKQKGLLAS